MSWANNSRCRKFCEAIKNLHKNNLYESLLSQVREKFTLGICLGMQLLMSQSDESPNTNGLNLIKGKCLKFEDRLIVPHVGWNSIEFSKESKLYDGIKNNTSFYFVHSYHVELIEKSVCLTETNYENFKFVSSLNFENIFGVQFHPEKSASYGLEIYRNFYKMLNKRL